MTQPRKPRGRKPPEPPPIALAAEALTFPSEEALRQAIAGLLHRIPDVDGVQRLHSAQEYGKDIVFVTEGPLGERRPSACVVKNGRITGDVSKQSGARNVLFQIEQALDTPYVDPTGQSVRIHHVYVMSPDPITTYAMNSIEAKLKEMHGSVVFVTGSDLFDLFEQHWPDFIADEAAQLQHHVERLLATGQAEEPLQSLGNLLDLGDPSLWPKHIYVPLYPQRIFHSYQVTSIDVLQQMLQPDPWHKRTTLTRAHVIGRSFVIEEWRAYFRLIRNSLLFTSTLPDEIFEAAEQSLNFLKSKLEVDLYESIQRQFGKGVAVSTIGMNEDLPLVDLPGLTASCGRCQDAIQPIIASLQSQAEQLAKLVEAQSNNRDSDSLLSSSQFPFLTALDDFFKQCPRTFIKVADQITIVFERAPQDTAVNHLLIVGAPGSGKTSYCRWNALADAESYRLGRTKTIPVLLRLNQFSNHSASLNRETLEEVIRNSALVREDVDIALDDSKITIRLYCDGLDEIPTAKVRAELLSGLEALQANQPNLQIIITSRPAALGPSISWLARLSLAPLSLDQFKVLARRWFDEDQVKADQLLEELTNRESLQQVIEVPLLATLLILTYKRTQNLPTTIATLYRTFTELLAGGWDLAKGIIRPTQFGKDTKLRILARLGLYAHEHQHRIFERKVIANALGPSEPLRSKTAIDGFLAEVQMDGLLGSEGGQFQFTHISFQEYFAARALLGHPTPTLLHKHFIEMIEGEDWWDEVVRHYIALADAPEEIADWMTAQIQDAQPDRDALLRLQQYFDELYPGYGLVLEL